mgnify:CR=1 FL=1
MEAQAQIDPQLIETEGVVGVIKGTGDALYPDQQEISRQCGGKEKRCQQNLVYTVFHQNGLLIEVLRPPDVPSGADFATS